MDQEFDVERAFNEMSQFMRDLAVQVSALNQYLKKRHPKVEAPSKFMSLDDAGVALGISGSSVRKRKCGTEDLHHVRQGDRVLLLRTEVESLAARRVAEAITPRERADKKLKRA